MKTRLIGTIVTYTISNEYARSELVELLESLDYVDDGDQSTMTNPNNIPIRTINVINEYCGENMHEFEDYDMISTYAAVGYKDGSPVTKYRIKRRTYLYNSELDAFV